MTKKPQSLGVSAILGPFVTKTNEPEPDRGDMLLQWGFIGTLADGEVVHWMLTYSAAKRTFSASRSPSTVTWRATRKFALGAYLWQGPPEPPFEKAFKSIGTGVPMHGRIRDMLRSLLSPADIARATALSFKLKG